MSTAKIDARDKDFPYKELPVMDLDPILKGDRDAIKSLAKEWRDVAEHWASCALQIMVYPLIKLSEWSSKL